MKRCLSVIVITLLTACAAPPPEVDPEYRAEIEAWRAARLERLTAEDGWLTLVGLDWLGPEFNRVGSNPHYEIPLKADEIPPLAATISVLDDGQVFLRAIADAGVTVNGEPTLEPYVDSPEDESYSLIFRDLTSGHTTYGAGRFLSAEAVGDDGTTVLDFNLAYNPPCAFTPFATCPLPTPQNSLSVAVDAGEKFSAKTH